MYRKEEHVVYSISALDQNNAFFTLSVVEKHQQINEHTRFVLVSLCGGRMTGVQCLHQAPRADLLLSNVKTQIPNILEGNEYWLEFPAIHSTCRGWCEFEWAGSQFHTKSK